MKYESITASDVNNGLGCRVTLWVSGCTHHCKQCHNRKTWSFSSGKVYNGKVEEVLFNEIDKPYIKGLTLSGGDPLDSTDGVLELLQHFRKRFGNTKDVWIYTGYTYEYCKEHFPEILELSDILVDGMYDCTKRDTSLAFRGSSNQRIIDLRTGEEISSNM
jgi:anaerobic ribonucleoside-triphosphate reductase activating protein